MVQGLGFLSCLSISSDYNFLFYTTSWSKLSLSGGFKACYASSP
nr:hypothetical protein Saspl_047920 [Ipomoea batatas]